MEMMMMMITTNCHCKILSLLFCFLELFVQVSSGQDLPYTITASPTPYSSTYEYPTPPADFRMFFNLQSSTTEPTQDTSYMSTDIPSTTTLPPTTETLPTSSTTETTYTSTTETTFKPKTRPPTTLTRRSQTTLTTTLSSASSQNTVKTTTTTTLPTTTESTSASYEATDATSTVSTASTTSQLSETSTPFANQTTEQEDTETTTDSAETTSSDLTSSSTVSTEGTIPGGDSHDQIQLKASSFGDVVLTAAIAGVFLLLTISLMVVFLRQSKRLKARDSYCQGDSLVYYAYPLPSYPVSYMY